ncbi:alginate export family protein [Paracoccus benzoatiresistens]|uniref:Alginate export family protein n=1 Tax=Paracoccus benzoatiresistens TaxID=2997341 RepID=A0ABT4J9W6_9RHOB|nr:alginate export family protein [Paracoccus sp. EF6]MCZ0963387.1 alginate export family protein [Paracoccus sp. EF6]
MTHHRHGARLGALCACLLLGAPAAAQEGGGLGGPGAVALPSALETLLVDTVEVRARGSTGDASRDAATLGAARASLGLAPGDRLSPAALDLERARIGRIAGVAEVRPRLAATGAGDRTRVIFEIELAPDAALPSAPSGILAGEGAAGFPYLWRSEERALRFILNGGHGVFSDGNPWFGNAPAFTTGNPLVQDPALGAGTDDRARWAESWIEFGLGGVSQVGDTNLGLYGAATAIAVAARGQDIFRDDPRETLDWEKAYVGLLWATEDRSRSVNLSFGRQNFTLNEGFLISQFGSQWNAGPRPGVYLAPRTTHDFAALGTVRIDRWTATAFYLDPNEYEPLESDTTLAGLNLRYSFTDRFHADASVIHAPTSGTRYAAPSGLVGTREGLTTYAAHVRWADPERAPGWWLESEVAHQRHSDFAMRAWAGYGTGGYLARDLPWTPSLSYRFSSFSGDDPDTATYERFDALYSGGLSEWLQGISLGKVLRPENRQSHRVRLNVAPTERLNLTLDWFLHRANELNNIGANPAIATLGSRDLGQELQLTARWAISDRLYFLGVASTAFPGDALKRAAGGDADPWTTLQAQLFWTF